MPFINLIQEQRLAIKRQERTTRWFFVGFAASAVLSVGTVGLLLFLTEMTESIESSLKVKAQKVQPILEEIQTETGNLNKLNPRLTTLEDARKMTGKWNTILDHLTTQTPQQTWLTSVRGQQPDPKTPVNITLTGMTVRQELVGEFMLRLQQCGELENVNLKFSQEKPVAQGSQIEFQLDSSIVETAEAKAVIAEEGKS